MLGKDLLAVVELFATKKASRKASYLKRWSSTLASATKKRYEDEEPEIEVSIDRLTGEYETFRTWLVRPDDEMAILGSELTTEEAEIDPSLQVGDVHRVQVENTGFGRIAAGREAGHRAKSSRS